MEGGSVRCPECGSAFEWTDEPATSPRVAKRTALIWCVSVNVALIILCFVLQSTKGMKTIAGVVEVVLYLWLVIGPPLVLVCTAQKVAPAYRKNVTSFAPVCWAVNLLFAAVAFFLLLHL